MSKKDKVCLDTVQMEHIIDAARGEPDACPKAIDWLNRFRPEKDSNLVMQSLDKYADRKVKKFIRDFKRWF